MARCVSSYADTYAPGPPHTVRTGYAYRPPVCCTCQRHRAACSQARYTPEPRGHTTAYRGTTDLFELPETVTLDDDPRLQRALNASSAYNDRRLHRSSELHRAHDRALNASRAPRIQSEDPYVRFPLPSLSARARTAAALDAAAQANRNFIRAYLC